jgi:chitodextrinase
MKRKIRIPVRFDQPGLTFDMPGLRFDQEFIEIEANMIQIVLNLQNLNDTDLIGDVRTSALGLTNHAADFTGITPSAADLTAAALTFENEVSANGLKQQEALQSTKRLHDARALLEGMYRAAAGWTEHHVPEEKAGNVWTLKRAATTTTSIGQVRNLSASFGDEPGEVHLAWNPEDKAKSYEIQRKGPGGEWTHAKTIGKSSVDIKGLTSGTLYQFRVHAIGPNELEGAWSDLAEHMAA